MQLIKNKSLRCGYDISYDFLGNAKSITEKEIVNRVIVSLDQIKGASAKDTELLMTAAMLMETGINSDYFYKYVTDPRLKLEFTNGLTNEQIFHRIVSGSSELEPAKDGKINLKVEIYYSRWSRTIGYTYQNTTWQWFNRKFLWNTKSGLYSLASNLLHEYCHKCGFDHQTRGYSRVNVPYFYGDTLEKVLEIIAK